MWQAMDVHCSELNTTYGRVSIFGSEKEQLSYNLQGKNMYNI